MKNKIKVTVFTGFEGHYSIGKAIHQAIRNDFQSNLVKLDLNYMTKAYMPFYRIFPSFFKIPFKLSQLHSVKKLFKAQLKQSKLNKAVWKELATTKPDVVISTWFYVNQFLEEHQQNTNTPFINIITDPKTPTPIIPSKVGINMIFDESLKKTCKSLGIMAKNIIKSGWFVRNEYESDYDSFETKKQLKISQNDLTFLVCGGSDGTNAVIKIIPALILQKTRLNIYFVCGSNKALYQAIKAFSKIIKTTHKNLNLVPLPFTNELYKYMQAADLVIGKAGPNLLFESIATLTPFFAITHISGQEDGNLDIIKQYKLGYVEENPIRATRLLQNIINNPHKLKVFDKNLKKMKSYNQKSKQILANTIQASVHSGS